MRLPGFAALVAACVGAVAVEPTRGAVGKRTGVVGDTLAARDATVSPLTARVARHNYSIPEQLNKRVQAIARNPPNKCRHQHSSREG